MARPASAIVFLNSLRFRSEGRGGPVGGREGRLRLERGLGQRPDRLGGVYGEARERHRLLELPLLLRVVYEYRPQRGESLDPVPGDGELRVRDPLLHVEVVLPHLRDARVERGLRRRPLLVAGVLVLEDVVQLRRAYLHLHYT